MKKLSLFAVIIFTINFQLSVFNTHAQGVGVNNDGAMPVAGTMLDVKGTTDDNTTYGMQVKNSSGTAIMVVRSEGNVGIGTAAPGNVLQVGGTASAVRYFQADLYGRLTGRFDDNSAVDMITLNNQAISGINDGIDLAFGINVGGGAPISSGLITVAAESDYSSAANRDSYIALSTTLDGTMAEKMRLNSGGDLMLGDGTFFGDSRLSLAGTNGNNDAVLTAVKADGTTNPVFSILPWDDQIFLSAGIYYSNGAWIQNSSTNNNQLLTMTPGQGMNWYASNNGTSSWNVSSNRQLWDDNSYWKSLVQSTRTGDSYFTGGNVGIGTTSPQAMFDVRPAGSEGAASIRFSSSGNSYPRIYMGGSDANVAFVINRLTSSATQYFGEAGDAGGFQFRGTGVVSIGNDRIYAKTDGNVGVGTSSPTQKLEVTGNIEMDSYLYMNGKETVRSTDTWLRLNQANAYTSGIHTPQNFNATGGITVGAYYYKPGTGNLHVEGNVAIGKTSTTQKLDVNGRIKSNGVNETSDERLKKNINTISNALSSVQQMEGVFYNWKSPKELEKESIDIALSPNTERLEMGFIAQDLERIIPELVDTDNEGYKSVQYSKVVALLVEALKEESNKRTDLEKIVADLKAQNEAQSKDLEKIKALLEVKAKK